MANEKNPDFMKLLEGLKDNEQSDIIKLPRHLIVNLDKVGNSIILFSNDCISICIQDEVLRINKKTAQLAYKDDFVQNSLLDYAETGNREKLTDLVFKLYVYHKNNEAINFLYRDERKFNDEDFIKSLQDEYNALRKEINNQDAEQVKEKDEQKIKN